MIHSSLETEVMIEPCLRHRGILQPFSWPILGFSCSQLAPVPLLGNVGSGMGKALPLSLGAVFNLQPAPCYAVGRAASCCFLLGLISISPGPAKRFLARVRDGPHEQRYMEQGGSSRGQHTQCSGHLCTPHKYRKPPKRILKSPSTWSHGRTCTGQHNSWVEICRVQLNYTTVSIYKFHFYNFYSACWQIIIVADNKIAWMGGVVICELCVMKGRKIRLWSRPEWSTRYRIT